MPNWCHNKTEIIGNADQIKKLVADLQRDGEDELRLANLIPPMPEALHQVNEPIGGGKPHPNWAVMVENGEMTTERYDELVAHAAETYKRSQEARAATGYSSWWEWEHANYGIKWGDRELYITETSSSEIELHYATPWAPFSETFFARISKNYPDLMFVTYFDEPGMCFFGVIAVKNGEVLFAEDRKYPEQPEGMDWNDPEQWDSWWETVLDAKDTIHADFWSHYGTSV